MNKKTIKSDKTKKKLCDTFIKIYSKKDISSITIGEITDKAGFNRGTFYIYYDDIYDMLKKIENSLLSEIENALFIAKSNNANLNLQDIPPILMDFYIRNEKYIQPLLTRDSSFVDGIKQRIFPLTIKALKLEEHTTNPYAAYLIEYHLSGTIAVLNKFISSEKEFKHKDIFDMLYSVVTTGVIPTLKNLY